MSVCPPSSAHSWGKLRPCPFASCPMRNFPTRIPTVHQTGRERERKGGGQSRDRLTFARNFCSFSRVENERSHLGKEEAEGEGQGKDLSPRSSADPFMEVSFCGQPPDYYGGETGEREKKETHPNRHKKTLTPVSPIKISTT